MVAILLLLVLVPTPVQALALMQTTFAASPATSLPNTMGSLSIVMRNAGDVTLFNVGITVAEAQGGIQFNQTRVTVGSLAINATSTAQLPFFVPASTAPGFYSVKIDIDGTSANDGIQSSLVATIAVRSPGTATVRSITPDRVQPGQEVQANITLGNTGAATLSNVEVSWSSVSNAILPIGGSNVLQVPVLAPYGELQLPIRFRSNPSAAPGLYALTFNLQYNDNTGARYDATSTVGLVLGGATAFSVSVQNITDDKVTLAVVNVGSNPVTAVQVRFVPSSGLAVDGADTLVLGDLGAGKFATAAFEVDRLSRGDVAPNATVEIAYTDSLGERRSQTQSVALQQFSAPPDQGTLVAITAATILGAEAVLLGAGLAGRRILLQRRQRLREAAREAPNDPMGDLVGLLQQPEAGEGPEPPGKKG